MTDWQGTGYLYAIEPDGTIKFTNLINWGNSLRFKNSKGTRIGFGRLSNVAGGAEASGKNFDVNTIVQQIRKGIDNKGISISQVTNHEENTLD